jgi:hypothetical protein
MGEGLVVYLHGTVPEVSGYSEAALQAVDRYFAAHPPRRDYRDEFLLSDFIPAIGAYLGESLVREKAAHWVMREPLLHSDIRLGDIELSPFRIAFERVYGGVGLLDGIVALIAQTDSSNQRPD